MRHAACLVFASHLVFVVAACSSSPAQRTCTSSADCAAGQACVDSHCVASTGDAGMCGAGCECSNDATCAIGAPSCVDAACVSGACFYRTHDERCASGQTCDMTTGCIGGSPDDAASLGDASTDAASASDTGASDAGPRDAGPVDTGTRSPLGGPCGTDADCAPISGTTVTCATMEGGVDFPGGYCTVACSSVLGTGGCPTGASCVLASGTVAGAFCAVSCLSTAMCRVAEGYTCHRPTHSFSTATVCVPAGI